MSTRLRLPFVLVCLTSLALIGWAASTLFAKQEAGNAVDQGREAAFDQPEIEPVPAVVHLDVRVTAQAAKTWIKLQETIPIQFPDATPLGDVLKYIKSAMQKSPNETTVPIYVDPRGLEEAEQTIDSTVALDLEGVPLATSLDLLLQQLGLTYYVQKDGIIMIEAQNDETKTISNPTAAILDNLSKLRTEVAALRAEVARMRSSGGAGGAMRGPMMMPGSVGAGMR